MTKLTLSELTTIVDGTLHGNADLTIHSIAPLDKADVGQLTFLTNEKYRQHLTETKATAVLIKESEQDLCLSNPNTNAIVVTDPYVAYALIAQALDSTPKSADGISQSAVIAADAILGANVNIAANAVIESGVELGDNVQIGAGCFIGKNTRIGANTKLWSNVSVYHGVKIGSNCLIQSSTVIGSDGFGYANQRGEWIKIPQVGGVVIGNRVEIGSCTVIDRGALDDTVIEDNVILDNHIQIAHNVHIGYGTAMAGSSTIAGSTTIGKYCIIGGAAVINGHITITDGVTITGMAMVMKSISEKGTYSSGIPLQSNNEWRRTAARTLKIDEMYKRLRTLEKHHKQD